MAGEDFVPLALVLYGNKFSPDGGAAWMQFGVFDGDFAHLAGGDGLAVDLHGQGEVLEERVALFVDDGGRGELARGLAGGTTTANPPAV
jgi:hypothetical protein